MVDWNLDWYATPYSIIACNDCAHLTPSSYRVLRGGGFYDAEAYLISSYRSINLAPTTRLMNVGFRCARSP